MSNSQNVLGMPPKNVQAGFSTSFHPFHAAGDATLRPSDRAGRLMWASVLHVVL